MTLKIILVLVILALARWCVAAGDDGVAWEDLGDWGAPSMPDGAADEHKGQRPVFMNPPLTSAAYAHRQGQLSVQLPPGATNFTLRLKSHEGFVFGTAYSPETIAAADLEWYQNMTASLFNGLTPENRFKWPLYERTAGQYEKARAVLEEQYVSFAQKAGFGLVRGHTLEWGKGTGFWAHELECGAYVAALKERVTRDVTLFKGKFNQYDVWNEIIDNPGMLRKCNLWDTAFPDAFKWAHEADPQAQLCINDFSLIEAQSGPKLMKVIKQHVLAHGAPIHCIGIQAHYEYYGLNLPYQKQQLDMLATLGLDLYISEFSLFSTWSGPKGPGHPHSYLDEDTQARATMELLRLWFSHPAVKGIIMWGWWDANIFSTNAGLYKANKQPKKAALAVQQLWGNELSTKVDVQQPPVDGKVSFKGFFGTYGYEYTGVDGGVVLGTLQLTRKQPQYLLADVGPQKEL